jgi:S-adenosylmethionine:tRNA ribosyltransferase-isomerase
MDFRELARYDYHLPSELIRTRGIEPRDSARLLVYDTATDTVFHDTFTNLAEYLPQAAVLVLNETRVVPARLILSKETGGKIEVFVLANEIGHAQQKKNGPQKCGSVNDQEKMASLIPIIVDRKCVPGMKLFFPDGSYFEVVFQDENRFFVGLYSSHSLFELLDKYGETPIPHYLEDRGEKQDEETLRKRYQTIFADSGASVAAPTASLHFTDRVFMTLEMKGIDIVKVGLDVGLGTFAPLRPEHFESRALHCERITVCDRSALRLNEAKAERRPIVAVGTTTLRTLESVVSFPAPHEEGSCQVSETKKCKPLFSPFSGETDIFIFPPHHFRAADILLTNFHLPKSSLMLLVDAFLLDKGSKRDLVSLYEEAICEKYSFYSFGDSMLIL